VSRFCYAGYCRYRAWNQAKPVWFTSDLIARIPSDFIPTRELAELDRVAGGQRRSSANMSVLELLAAAPNVPAVPALPSLA
jgi:hypothetical protein